MNTRLASLILFFLFFCWGGGGGRGKNVRVGSDPAKDRPEIGCLVGTHTHCHWHSKTKFTTIDIRLNFVSLVRSNVIRSNQHTIRFFFVSQQKLRESREKTKKEDI